ncbi:glyoxalase [Microbacterium sp. ARD32]|uniref:glyoxalase n=1 Tax=Microbacterium sp. ARD32 TaxID=2962577 RepID=UPI002881A493|nr:glyoxalase [Microbacterium sp. ARD32]MDT0157145.1 glyoxalase [Microbacterium sp. ARD32]
MNAIEYITLEVNDLSAAQSFYDVAFGVGDRLRLTQSDAATGGFRGFTLSLVASQPADVDALFQSGLDAGATVIKPATKSLWGYGGTLQAPDGAIWKLATGAKKNAGPGEVRFDSFVLLLGAASVPESKRFYTGRGFEQGKSFGSYAELGGSEDPVRLALYKRAALAKDAGVPAAGTGSHRLVIHPVSGEFVDPDGFVWA